MNPELVFVYGTLKKGKSNHDLLRGAKFLNTAELMGAKMYSLGHYPAIKVGDGRIHGEVYEVPTQEIMDRLDRLEGHPVFYRREIVTLCTRQEAWTYFLVESAERYPVIPSGEW